MKPNPATQQDPATLPPAAATLAVPPTAEPRKRYHNPFKGRLRKRREWTHRLPVPFNREAATNEELDQMAAKCRAFYGLRREARKWASHADTGGFIDPDGKEHSLADCNGLAEQKTAQADLLFRQMKALADRITARAIATGDTVAAARALFCPPPQRHLNGHRNRRGGRHRFDGAALPVVKPRQ